MATPAFIWDSSVNKSILAFYNSVTGLPVFMDETTGLPVDVIDRDARILGRTKIHDGTNVLDVLIQDSAFGAAAKGLGVFGKYQVTPTAYTDGDAVPILLDANGRIVLASDIQLGAVELKDADTDNRANIKAANTARTTGTLVLATQPVDAAGAVLSTSALATSAKQDTLDTSVNTLLKPANTLAGVTTVATVTNLAQQGGVAIALNTGLRDTGTQRVTIATDDLVPISAASLPLPTDAATQTTLALIKAKTDNIPALGQALASASVPVILPAATITTLTPPAAITGFALETTQLLQPLAATTPTIYNVTMTLADTEYSQALPANTKILEFRNQDVGFATRFAYETGKVAGSVSPYGLLAAGEVKTTEGLNLTGKTLYFACGTALKTLQIECWT